MEFIKVDNIFDHYPESIVHPINCHGLCHDPFSKKMKRVFSEYFGLYTRACLRKHLEPYCIYHHEVNSLFRPNHIFTITIKNNWQEKLKQECVSLCLHQLLKEVEKNKVTEMALPFIEGIPKDWFEAELKSKFSKNLKQIYLFDNQ